MPRRNITDRLNSGEVLLMDGATGSEVQARGVEVLIGATKDTLGPWSGTANIDAPEVVQQVHSDHLRCGAEILISNNFWTGPSRMAYADLSDQWERYARAGAQNAIKARDAMNPEAYVAGGIAPPGTQRWPNLPPESNPSNPDNRPDVEIRGEESVREEFAAQARVLADEGVDLMLPEFVGYIDDCVAAVDGCAEVGLPVWLGLRNIHSDGTMDFGESLPDLVSALEGHKVDMILLMCSPSASISAGLPILRDAFDGPVGAYPNIGYHPRGLFGADKYDSGTEVFPAQHTTSEIAEFAREWIDMGAQVVGGCCGMGPAFTLAMRPVVDAARAN